MRRGCYALPPFRHSHTRRSHQHEIPHAFLDAASAMGAQRKAAALPLTEY